MSNAGQAVLTIGGTIVGSFFGNPQLGYLLGSLAGQALFPTDLGTVTGPRLNDLTVMTSTIGAPIPLVYGSFAVAGNLIWSSGIIEEVSKTKQGGKGGPTQTLKEYTYSVNCAVGICEGPIGGIRRIWADSQLIYDARPRQPNESDRNYNGRVQRNAQLLLTMNIYLGDETQLPDPNIEAFEGVGNVSAFRGLAYVVFTQFQLENYGNRVPSFRFETAGDSTPVTVGTYNPGYLPYWRTGAEIADPRVGVASLYEYNMTYGVFDGSFSTNLAGAWVDSVGPVLEAQYATRAYTDTPRGYADWVTMSSTANYRIGHWPCSVGTYPGSPYAAASDLGGKMQVDLFFNCFDNVPTYCLDYGEGYEDVLTANPGQVFRLVSYMDTNLIDNPGVYAEVPLASPNTIAGIPASVKSTGVTTKILVVEDTVVRARRFLTQPFDPCYYATEISEDELWCYVDGFWISVLETWQYVDAPLKGLKVYEFASPNDPDLHYCTSRPITNELSGLPMGEYLPSSSPSSTQAYWEARYAEAVANGWLPSGWTYGDEYPMEQQGYWAIEYDAYETLPEKTSYAQIVRDCCLRAGLTAEQIDVSEIGQEVTGYAVTRVMSARDAIEPLRSAGWFDCVESDAKLKWPKRGKPIVAALTEDDIAAREGADDPQNANVSTLTTRAQEVELPRRLRVHYAQYEKNYEAGEQSASRLAAGSVQVRDVELAIAMSDEQAAKVADVLLYELWHGRTTHKFTVDHRWLALEPADAITIPIDDQQERVRIVSIDDQLPGLRQLDVVRDDDGVFVSYALAAQSGYAAAPGNPPVTILGDAEVVLLDLPLLRDADDDAGYYAAIRNVGGNTFSGAALYRSADGGATYAEVATTARRATIGSVVTALPVGPTTIVDEGNALVVAVDEDLVSITDASLVAGLNAAAIGADGRWEIVQFRDAELLEGSPTEWRLTGLLRGRRGTEWAMGTSAPGDTFVLLDTSVVRVPSNVAAIGAARLHKAVMVGATVESATPVSFTADGVALEPFAPVSVEGTRDISDNLTITWIRRGRIGEELPSGADIPLSEESEAYEIDVLDGTTVVRTLTSSTQSVAYSAAQQTTDFGSPQAAVDVRVYQLSATVGRGYPAEATV